MSLNPEAKTEIQLPQLDQYENKLFNDIINSMNNIGSITQSDTIEEKFNSVFGGV